MFFDTHAHLDDAAFDEDRDEVIKRIREAGVDRVLNPGCDEKSTRVAAELAEKHDWWFHAKGTQGSHVLLVTNGDEPSETDFTEAAEIAAAYSRADGGEKVDVDYTLAKHVKRVPGGKMGLVIYHTNWTCYVTPDKEKIADV